MAKDEKTEVSCQFCDVKDTFTGKDIEKLIRRATK